MRQEVSLPQRFPALQFKLENVAIANALQLNKAARAITLHVL